MPTSLRVQEPGNYGGQDPEGSRLWFPVDEEKLRRGKNGRL
jgi:hypothetical protein